MGYSWILTVSHTFFSHVFFSHRSCSLSSSLSSDRLVYKNGTFLLQCSSETIDALALICDYHKQNMTNNITYRIIYGWHHNYNVCYIIIYYILLYFFCIWGEALKKNKYGCPYKQWSLAKLVRCNYVISYIVIFYIKIYVMTYKRLFLWNIFSEQNASEYQETFQEMVRRYHMWKNCRFKSSRTLYLVTRR